MAVFLRSALGPSILGRLCSPASSTADVGRRAPRQGRRATHLCAGSEGPTRPQGTSDAVSEDVVNTCIQRKAADVAGKDTVVLAAAAGVLQLGRRQLGRPRARGVQDDQDAITI